MKNIQQLNRDTINYISTKIVTGMSLSTIRKLGEDYLMKHGVENFWYWDIGAFVFSGTETAISVSGKKYVTSNKIIAENDIITIDLSPKIGGIWGDYARTIVIENGKVVLNIDDIKNEEWKKGLKFEDLLHETLLNIAHPEMTFECLFIKINALIKNNGFVNLDFARNLGHSIVYKKSKRIYIKLGNTKKLSSVNYFTFEPHISLPNSQFGFKKENIYYFEDSKLVEL